MCGISVLFALRQFDVGPYIRPMTEVIRHRGPDDEGYALIPEKSTTSLFLGGDETIPHVYGADFPYAPKGPITVWPKHPCRVAMGHRRLSIVDLSSAGHQPMCTQDGRYLLVYNGEIYNHLELREELTAKGYTFCSHTDTEVVLAAYREWGSACLDRFVGMFAFVLYDIREDILFAVRDRFGVKPLYYWFSPKGYLAFASEIKQFTVLPGWSARLNGPRVYDFLSRKWADHTAQTLFADVRQLRGGESVHCCVRNIRNHLPVNNWYEPQPQTVDLDFEKAGDRLRELFYDSIHLHQRADVPVGTGLSGGLDSSSIVCAVNEILRKRKTQSQQNTFSSCSHIEAYDERPFIQEVIKKTEIKAHYTFPPLEELFDTLGDIHWHHDEPVLTTSVYAEWHVFKLVSQTSVKVTLEGHGADELLAGYPVFFKAKFRSLLAKRKWSELFREYLGIRRVYGKNPDFSLVNGMRRFFSGLSGRRSEAFPLAWMDTAKFQYDEPGSLLNELKNENTISEISRIQLLHTSLPVQLHWADRDSMAHSIECRVPYLDHRLVEFLLGCPDDFKIKYGTTKRILRRAMEDKLPDKVTRRTDKMGYVTPEEVWVKKGAPDMFMSAVERAVEQTKGNLKRETISAASRIIKGSVPYDPVLWRVISLGAWMDRFGVE